MTSRTEEAGHTPGPWFVDPDDTLAIRAPDGDDEPWHVAEVIEYCGEGDQTEANARLIAAAPDLLEALKELHKKTVIGTDAERHAALHQAWAAIYKATTEPKGDLS